MGWTLSFQLFLSSLDLDDLLRQAIPQFLPLRIAELQDCATSPGSVLTNIPFTLKMYLLNSIVWTGQISYIYHFCCFCCPIQYICSISRNKWPAGSEKYIQKPLGGWGYVVIKHGELCRNYRAEYYTLNFAVFRIWKIRSVLIINKIIIIIIINSSYLLT